MSVNLIMAILYLGLPVIHLIATFILIKIVSREGNV